MFALSDVEKSGLLVVDSSLAPFGVTLFILDFIFSIPLAGNNHQKVLEVFGQDILLLFAFENSVNVFHQLFVLW